MNRIISLLLVVWPALSIAQSPGLFKYWVVFTDKNNSPHCLCRPAELLGPRALERRHRAGIPLDESDLPVNPDYLTRLTTAGATVHLASRWLNAAAVIADPATAERLKTLPFVDTVQYLGPDLRIRHEPYPPARARPVRVAPASVSDNPYGYAALQNSLLNLPLLHFAGHRGQGIHVAVFDGGFTDADVLPFFDSVALGGRLTQVRDVVERDNHVYEAAGHGTAVLSVMAANIPGLLVGGAPDAAYFLFKTEDTGGEFPIEECNWVAAAECADSMGIDIINASLGYTTFNDTTLSHAYGVLNGRTAIGSRGAAMAARKGMIVCNSAGNSGDEPWRHIGVPSDAPGVVAVGAVDYNGNRASFSSMGPTPDGRIKPDLVAPGEQVVVAGGPDFGLGLSNGTSLASPMLTGGIAALWSAFPEKTATEILGAVYASGDQYANPDPERGFGLPDLTKAWGYLAGWISDGDRVNNARNGFFAADPEAGVLTFWSLEPLDNILEIRLFNALGNRVGERHGTATTHHRVRRIELSGLQDLPAGTYQVEVLKEAGTTRFIGLMWR